MRIDSHIHLWDFKQEEFEWIDDAMSILQRDFSPCHIIPVLKRNNFDGAIAVQARALKAENDFLVHLATDYSEIKGVVGWADLKDRGLPSYLDYLAAYDKLKGIRTFIQDESLGYMDQTSFRHGLTLLKDYDFSFDLLIREDQVNEARQLVKRNPYQKFVIDHLAKPSYSEGMNDSWNKNMRDLGALPNVYCKISGLVTETRNMQWEYQEFTPFLDVVVNSFGPKRLMFGSDWPVCKLSCGYEDVLKICEQYFSTFSEDEYKAVMGLTATEFYRLEKSKSN